MRREDLSHCRKQSLALRPTPTELKLKTGNYYFPCFVDALAKLECPLQCAVSLGEKYGELGLPKRQAPPLSLTGRFQRKGWANTFGHQVWPQELPEGIEYVPTALGAPLRIFPWGLLPKPLLLSKQTTRQWCYLTHNWELVRGHQGVSTRRWAMHAARR